MDFDIQLCLLFESGYVVYHGNKIRILSFMDIIFGQLDLYNNEIIHLTGEFAGSKTQCTFHDVKYNKDYGIFPVKILDNIFYNYETYNIYEIIKRMNNDFKSIKYFTKDALGNLRGISDKKLLEIIRKNFEKIQNYELDDYDDNKKARDILNNNINLILKNEQNNKMKAIDSELDRYNSYVKKTHWLIFIDYNNVIKKLNVEMNF